MHTRPADLGADAAAAAGDHCIDLYKDVTPRHEQAVKHARKTTTAMQLFHFIAAWLFPGAAVSKVAKTAMMAESFEPDNASWLAFSDKAGADDSCSPISSPSPSPSPSSSSSEADYPRFFASRQEHSPPTSPLCFGAGGGVGRLLLLLRGSRGARARSPPTPKQEAAASVAPAAMQHGDVVARYLRKISRRMRKARRGPDKQGSPSPTSPRRAADDTARERAESVARAVAYCKDTLRRGTAPPPSPSLYDCLHDRQEEIIASAAAYYCDRSTDSQTPGPPLLDGSLATDIGIECSRVSQSQPPLPPRVHRDDVVHGKELPPLGHDALDKCRGESATTMAETAMSSSSPSDLAPADELRMPSSFDEMELLKNFNGDDDEEMIGRHFITIQI